MSEKAAGDDPIVACIARKVLTLFLTLEAQFVDVPTAKPTSASKIKGQREQLMPLVYMAVKAMKRRAKKASARAPVDHALLQRDFGVFWYLSVSALATTPFTLSTMANVPCKELAFPQTSAPPTKRAREEAHVTVTMQHAS